MSRNEEFHQSLKAHKFYGKDDIDAMFHDGAPKRPVPWEQASRRKDREDYDKGAVAAELKKPPSETQLHEVDPRDLHAYQPEVVRGGVKHYMGTQFHQTGETFADQGKAYNAHPVVYRREGLEPGMATQNIILSGHHRAAAALLQGRPLQARVVNGPWGPERNREGPVTMERTHPRLKGL